jgi:hypothetical protein
MKEIAEVWDTLKEMLLWGSEQTGIPIGTVIVTAVLLVVAYRFIGLLWRGRE